MYAITRYIKPSVPMLFNTHLLTSLGVRMRTPFKNGRWIGWTDKEVEMHLKSVRDYSKTLPPVPVSNGNGC
jgi:hypothetical protein